MFENRQRKPEAQNVKWIVEGSETARTKAGLAGLKAMA
jgi:hypothetical protein